MLFGWRESSARSIDRCFKQIDRDGKVMKFGGNQEVKLFRLEDSVKYFGRDLNLVSMDIHDGELGSRVNKAWRVFMSMKEVFMDRGLPVEKG